MAIMLLSVVVFVFFVRSCLVRGLMPGGVKEECQCRGVGARSSDQQRQ